MKKQTHRRKPPESTAGVETARRTDKPADSQEKPAAGPDAVKNAVGQLSEELQKLTREMLVEGSTFEDVMEAVNERGCQSITLSAVRTISRVI